jgi:serine/threonine-protein kinase
MRATDMLGWSGLGANRLRDARGGFFAALGFMALGGAAIAVGFKGHTPERPFIAFDLALPDSLAPVAVENAIDTSSDGSRVAYIGGPGRAVLIRALTELLPQSLAGTEGASCPSFSPDGRWLSFIAQRQLKKIAVDGGSPVTVLDSAGTCAVWTDRNELVLDIHDQLYRVPADGGSPAVVARIDTARRIGIMRPTQALPGGTAVLINLSDGFSVNFQVGLVSLADGEVTRLTPESRDPRYGARYANGQVLFLQEGKGVWAAPLSLAARRLTGSAMLLVDGALDFSASRNGHLAFLAGDRGSRSLEAVNLQGAARPLWPARRPTRERAVLTVLDTAYYSWLRISPDGERVALEVRTGPWSWDVWAYDISSRTVTRVTTNFSGARPVRWTANGSELVYLAFDSSASNPTRVVAQRWDGSTPPRTVLRLPANVHDVTVGPPHTYALFTVVHPQGKLPDIWIAPLDTAEVVRGFETGPSAFYEARLSPDGRLVAYTGVESGLSEIYVRPVPRASSRLQVSSGGGMQPVWSADGRSLFYRGSGHVVRATIATNPEPRVIRRDTLFRDVFAYHNFTNYDVLPGSRELLMIRETPGKIDVTVLMHWPALLRQRAAR